MKACLVLFLFSWLANFDLISSTQNNTDCEQAVCGSNNVDQVYQCKTKCATRMMEIEHSCPPLDVTPGLSGVTGTMDTLANTTNAPLKPTIPPVSTTVPPMNSTIESVTTNVTWINTTTGLSPVYCKFCPQNCEECNFNSTTKNASCTKCSNGYQLDSFLQCLKKGNPPGDGDSSDSVVAIVVGSVCGGLVIIIVAIVIVCCIKRRRSNKADVSGQCQLRVVSTDQLSDGKPKKLHHTVSVTSDSGELDKLPMAPAPPINYDQLGIAENEELNYEPFDPTATQPNSKTQSADPSNVETENVYVNAGALNSNSANLQKPASQGGKSPRPDTKSSHDMRGSNSPQMDNVYTNFNADANCPQNRNFPSSGLNDSEASLEMDDIYINETVEDVRRPSASRPKPASNKVEKVEEEPVSLVQDDIYCNDPAQVSPSEPDQLYEVPEGAAPSRQSDIYINASPDLIYENLN